MIDSELYDERDFHYFCKALRIDSKEKGLTSLGDCLLGSQLYLLDKIREGMARGVREFVTLKARQLGISTITLALDLYWVTSKQALPAAIVVQDEASRANFRTTLALYRSSLPEEYQRDVIDDNRDLLVFDNGSRIRFLVAGVRARSSGSSNLGRSGALVAMHATEVAYWGDASGVDALRASFAHSNPHRLYHWESTANGDGNWFKDMWLDAKGSKAVMPIFVSWWANDDYYSLSRDSRLYQHYWGLGGRRTRDEELISRDVKKFYDVDIDDCQWAWYRYMAAEKITDEARMAQEFPHRESDAFISTGSSFFLPSSVSEVRRHALAARRDSKHYRIECGRSFQQTKVVSSSEKNSNLVIYVPPSDEGYYVLGVDPAFASSPTSDASAIEVFRCWYNRMEQVAEFADNGISTHACAWVFAYLAGFYARSTVNIEVTGPGGAVLQEFNNMKRQAYSNLEGEPAAMREVVGPIRQYLYRRPDSTLGPTTFRHTKTTFDIRETMMNGLKDYLERGAVILRSDAVANEMATVRRDQGDVPKAHGRKRDDLVTAAALACMCWNDQMRSQLLAQGIVYREPQAGQTVDSKNPLRRVVDKYFTSIGLIPSGGVAPPAKKFAKGQRRWNGDLRRRLQRAENSRSG